MVTKQVVPVKADADRPHGDREKAGQLIDEASAAPFRMLMHVSSPVPDHKNIRISYVGAPWPEALTTVKHAPFFGSADHQTEEISDYITRVLQVSRIVAPDALYQFTGLDEGLTTKSLLEGLDAIAGAGTDVLIFTYATRGQLPFLTALRGLSEKMIVILAAGNDGGQSAYASVDDVALVVGAADSDGQLMSFSDKSERSVSAPGAKIPITSPATGEISPSNGSSFSAAFAGAAAALLKAKFPTATPKQVVSALRDTAKGPARSIDVTAALQKLGEALQAAGANH